MSKPTESSLKLMKALGMKYVEETDEISCSGRPGYVYFKLDGKMVPLAVDRITKKIPMLDCEHDAAELITSFYQHMFVVGLQSILQGKNPPKLPAISDFRYVFADDEPEIEVTCTDEADELLARIKGALS